MALKPDEKRHESRSTKPGASKEANVRKSTKDLAPDRHTAGVVKGGIPKQGSGMGDPS